MMDLMEKEEFIMLSRLALEAAEGEKFIEYLLKRDPYIISLLKDDPRLFGDDTRECLDRESAIQKRLEEERTGILKKMDELSKKKTMKTYSSTFPFPPWPAYK